jgi:MFS family permease
MVSTIRRDGSGNTSFSASVYNKVTLLKGTRIFYGYWILIAAFLCVCIFSGTTYGAFSLFVKPLQSYFGWSRGGVMAAFTILLLVMGAAAPFAGGFIDRYGVRLVISAGAFIGGLGFIILNLMTQTWHFYAAYVAIGLGMASIGQVPASALVSNWFVKRRGTAIGIMSTGIGVGGLVFPPLLGSYILPDFGWRVAYLFLAMIVWMLIPLALFVIRTKPSDMGLYPDGVKDLVGIASAKTVSSISNGSSLKAAVSTMAFWLIAATFLAQGFSAVGMIQNQVPHLQDIGFSSAIAAVALAVVGLGSAIGKFIFGKLCDLIQPKKACAISLVLLATGSIILISIKGTSPLPMVWLYAIVMGLGSGGWLPTMSMLASTTFGLTSYGAIFGMITLIHSTGGALGPLFAGYLYDTMNTYHQAFVTSFILFMVGIPAVLAIRRRKALE